MSEDSAEWLREQAARLLATANNEAAQTVGTPSQRLAMRAKAGLMRAAADEIGRLREEVERLKPIAHEAWLVALSCQFAPQIASQKLYDLCVEYGMVADQAVPTKDDDQKAKEGTYVPGQERSGKSSGWYSCPRCGRSFATEQIKHTHYMQCRYVPEKGNA